MYNSNDEQLTFFEEVNDTPEKVTETETQQKEVDPHFDSCFLGDENTTESLEDIIRMVETKADESPSGEENELPYYDYNCPGKDLHKQRKFFSFALRKELLDLSAMNEDQKRELDQCGTLCWYCQHAIDLKCPWFQGFHPVKGWVAELEIVGGVGRSYMIYDCPGYTPTERKKLKVLTKW